MGPVGKPRRALIATLRMASAVLVIAMGAIHLYLWQQGYRDLPVIGVLFLLNVVGSGLLTILLAMPGRALAIFATFGVVFTVGTLAALMLSLTVGLFGFREYVGNPLVLPTIAVEAAGTVTLAWLTALTRNEVSGVRRGWRANREPD